jgi:xylitol oxidase
MNKREFLKASGALITGGVWSQLMADETAGIPGTNWSGNYHYHAEHLYAPRTTAEVCNVVKSSAKAKALGKRHSFDGIADTTGAQISLEHLTEMAIDHKSHTVTVGAGVSYGTLSPYLYNNGYALHNLASLPHISVAGARSTATHGSGIKNGNLATVVCGLELITADGELVELSRDRNQNHFSGAVVDLGALGIVTKLRLELQPKFDVRQVVYENLPMDRLENHLDEIFSSGYSVSLFTDWQNHRITQAWIKRRVEPRKSFEFPKEFFGGKLATRNLHPLAGHSAENCTEQLGIPGPWYERLPHFRMNFTPSSGQELQTEYFVPRERAYQAILAVEHLRDEITPHLFITELRTIAADELWMSPCYKRASLTIHFTWKPEWPAVKALLPKIEEQLLPFEARPHWAKLFTMQSARLQSQYARLADFKALMQHYDPHSKFRNEFLTANLFS